MVVTTSQQINHNFYLTLLSYFNELKTVYSRKLLCKIPKNPRNVDISCQQNQNFKQNCLTVLRTFLSLQLLKIFSMLRFTILRNILNGLNSIQNIPNLAFAVYFEDMFDPKVNATLVKNLLEFLEMEKPDFSFAARPF
eukprot:TRINITY_DN9431_c0_g1_i2.p2 TRINITY_DN9431_c0_g1~~TRINITY_DN9431_c0_g1_i2.p2  ORF type:complete len:138 (+),score=4.87 TRINITY_DN9431_c0_g1_i2:242-655(+)